MRIGILCACVLLSVIWVACPCDASPVTAELAGVVSGPDGAGLAGAVVRFRHLETGRIIEAVTGARGVFRRSNLAEGEYEARVELQGFEPLRVESVRLAAGEPKILDFKLAIATIQDIVTVVANIPRDTMEASEARESSARDVGEALAQTTGVSKLRKGGIANEVVVRGLQSRDLNVLIDGQRIYGACPNHMDPPAFHVDFSEVDRVEVGKGPFDPKNQGSLGGVVNIVTRKPESGVHATANLSTGSYGLLNPSGTASYANNHFSALGGYSYRVSAPYTDGGGRRFTEYTNYRPDQLDSDAFRVGTAWGRLSFSPSANQRAQVSYTHQSADHVLYPYLMMDAIYDNADRLNTGYSIENLSDTLKALRIQAYYSRVRHWMTDLYRTSSTAAAGGFGMGTFAKTRAIGGRVETEIRDVTVGVESFSRGWSAWNQMAGMGYMTQYAIPDANMNSFGAYASYRRSLSDRARLDVNGRVDRVWSSVDPRLANTNLYYAYNTTRATQATDTFGSGSARITYALPLGLEVGAGVGHTGRPPDPTERYFALRRAGSDWVGNPDLVPTRNTGVDGSLSLRGRRLLVNSSFYFYGVTDYISVRKATRVNMVPGVMNTGARSYANVDARLYGGELQAVYTLSRRMFLSGSLQQVRGLQDSRPEMNIYSENLAEMPPLTGRASMRFDSGRIWAELEGVAASPQRYVDTDLREDPTAGYGVANIRAGASWRRLSAWVGVNNIFDHRYYEHLSFQRDPFRSGVRVYEPGRNLFVNVSWRF